MAMAGDPVLEELHRAVSASSSVALAIDSDSTFSLNQRDVGDIDAVVNRMWSLDEVIGPLRTKLVILSGGRDKRGAPILTISATDHSNLRPINLGMILSYLAKVPDESLQGLGFTVILDMRHASWDTTKRALKSLQLTFVEHIFQVYVVKPKRFWQRQKTGMNFHMKRSKFNYPVVMLENGGDLFHYFQVSQITRELGGMLSYDHEEWLETQKILEKHIHQLLAKLADLESLREQLDQPEQAINLNEARDGVRRHVEAKQQLDRSELDTICQAVDHAAAKLQPCSNPDFTACFSRLEELSSGLLALRDRLERVWDEKGGRLDQFLQLRVYESDSEKVIRWVRDEKVSLAHEHTSIGDSARSAELRRKAFEEFRARMANKYGEVSRVMQLGERLIAAYHFASETLRGKNIEVRCFWEGLIEMVDERSSLLDLSIVFHDRQKQFIDHVEDWVDDCMIKDYPSDISQAEELLHNHQQLRETYEEMYSTVRKDGHKLIEKLRKPVGESSLPATFIIGTRHVKETLEEMYDEKNWLYEQWERRNIILRQALNLRKFQEEAKKVHSWITDVGNPFLALGNTIGNDAGRAQWLLNRHDTFESETERINGLAIQLLAKAKELGTSGECQPEMIEGEASTLEENIHSFAARMDERREIIVQAFEYYQKAEILSSELKNLNHHIPLNRFDGLSHEVEPRLNDFQNRRNKVNKTAEIAFGSGEILINRLQQASQSSQGGVRSPVNYATALVAMRERLEQRRAEKGNVDEVCDRREKRWNLTIKLNQFKKDVKKHVDQQDSWTGEEARQTEWEPSTNSMDAQQQLDAFQLQYDQLHDNHQELVSRGRSTADEIDQLDSLMFGGPGGEEGEAVHPAVVLVKGLVEELERSVTSLERTASPKLQKLTDCLQFHLLQQRASKLASAFSQLSSTITRITSVGHTLEVAQSLWQQTTEANQKLKAVSQDAESFSEEVAECLQRDHYESTTLSMLARAVQEKQVAVNRTMTEKARMVRASVEFHQNVAKLSSTMENCTEQFSSRDVGASVSDVKCLLHSLTEVEGMVSQTVEDVQSQGKKLLEIMAATSGANAPRRRSDDQHLSPSQHRRGSDYSLAENQTTDYHCLNLERRCASYNALENADYFKPLISINEDETDSPKLLVSPRKIRPVLQSATSLPAAAAILNPCTPEQMMIEGLLELVESRRRNLRKRAQSRRTRLEQSQKVILFTEAVPEVLMWVESVGAKYLNSCRHNYGRSIKEVNQLVRQYQVFMKNEVQPVAERVRRLFADYRNVEKSGYHKLNEVRTIANSLETTWGKFDQEMGERIHNLEFSMKFQESLFEASNWCQKTYQFLESMEEKIRMCDTSSEAAELATELALYLAATKSEQSERVKQVQRISSLLRSNLLVELANQVEQSTERTIRDFEACQSDAETLHEKLVQIESEKDRERRLIKQRERVLEELLQTEQAYTSDLKLVVEKCRPRFVSDVMPNTLRGKEGIIFSNVHEIELFHRTQLLPKMKEMAGDYNSTAQIFVDCADEMAAIYVPFCMNKTASEELLTSHRTYLRRMQSLFGTETPLSSLLIKPVQRITKYPLLLKDALKYTTHLGQPTQTLEDALKAVERIPVETNNAIHFGLLEGSEDWAGNLGKLLFQGLLQVSEPKFGLKAGKERQVFVFQSMLLFARKVDLGQAKFKYEYKFKLPISPDLQVIEFLEGEASKFCLTRGDHRMHLKAPSVNSKQQWIKALKSAVLLKNKNTNKLAKMEVEKNDKTLLAVESWPRELRAPSPNPLSGSPNSQRKMNGMVYGRNESPLPGFERYQSKEDFVSSGDHPFSLTKGDIVEVLDNNIDGKWFVRSVREKVDHGWVPSGILERLSGEDSVDGKSQQWVQITAGPLNSTSDEEKWRLLKQQTHFGSHDLHSQQVISNLRKVTFNITSDAENDTEADEEVSMLNRLAIPLDETKHLSSSLEHFPQHSPRGSPKASPRESPRNSPLEQRRNTVGADGDRGESSKVKFRKSDSASAVITPSNGGIEQADWRRSKWRRNAVMRKRSTGRSTSVTSDKSDEQPDSPMEKSLQSSGSEEEGMNGTAVEGEDDSASVDVTEEDVEKVRKAQEKIKYIMAELLETEREYVNKLDGCINGFMREMQSPNLPDALKGKEKLVFGNIQAVYEFHHKTFLHLLEKSQGSIEDIAQCFLDQTGNFEVYVTYCENKPRSESFLWTYQHSGGTFFEEVQNQLGHRQGIASFLIKPVQRITKYQLLLRDLHKSAQKVSLETPNLEKAHLLMQDIPKRANDAMALSMIDGYDGNIQANGQIILHDDFTVYERNRWTAARRHIFLLDQRLILTKEKDADGLYVYKDSLKVHSLFVAEKEGDSPSRFTVGTGRIADSDQYYVLEASSPEKKQQWVQAIKDILKQQFELLKALRTPKPRSRTFDSAANQSVALMIDSEDEDEEEGGGSTPVSPWEAKRASTVSVGEATPSTPPLKSARPFNLYVVAEDCAPPKDDEGIFYIHKGEVFDVVDETSEWWFARLVRDVTPDSERVGSQGWVPSSFLDKFQGSLSLEDEAALQEALARQQRQSKRSSVVSQGVVGSPKGSPKGSGRRQTPWSPKSSKDRERKGHRKLHVTSSVTFKEPEEEEEEEEEIMSNPMSPLPRKSKAPQIVSHLSNETVMVGRSVQLRCLLNDAFPLPTVEWSHNGTALNIDRAFTSIGEESCVLRIKGVEQGDGGLYTCTVTNPQGVATSSAKVVVIGPPDPPSRPVVQPLTSTSVTLSWTPPRYTGHSPITIYLVECKDTISDRWSTLMKRITEPTTVVSDLMPGTEYVFRVLVGNQIGSSEPSEESEGVRMARSHLETDFSIEPFETHYELMDEIGRGRYSTVYECLHRTTQQPYAAKLLPVEVGKEKAQQELQLLSRLTHRNIVQMTSAYLTEKHFIMLFHMIQGVNLFEYFTASDSLTESSAAACIQQITSGLRYLHSNDIAHLDIKPENIMAVEREGMDYPDVKLIHFDRAREIEPNSKLVVKKLDNHTEYEAPEILSGKPVTLATDMWSLGVVLYTLLSGSSPFLVDSLDLTRDNVLTVRYSFPAKLFRDVSESAKDLVAKMLVKDMSNRISSLQCLGHPWLETGANERLNASRLKSYMSSRKWQSSLMSNGTAADYR